MRKPKMSDSDRRQLRAAFALAKAQMFALREQIHNPTDAERAQRAVLIKAELKDGRWRDFIITDANKGHFVIGSKEQSGQFWCWDGLEAAYLTMAFFSLSCELEAAMPAEWHEKLAQNSALYAELERWEKSGVRSVAA